MPYSSFLFDDEIEEIISFLKPRNILDVGAGAGKYGRMIKKINKNISSTAIEIEKDYIKKFKLKEVYDNILNIPAQDLLTPYYYEKKFDVVMISDVIEHLKKSEGIDLINFLIYRSKWLIIKFPNKYLQDSVDGYSSEAHISVWSGKDFDNFDKTSLYEKEDISLILLRGYLEEKTTILDIEEIINQNGRKN